MIVIAQLYLLLRIHVACNNISLSLCVLSSFSFLFLPCTQVECGHCSVFLFQYWAGLPNFLIQMHIPASHFFHHSSGIKAQLKPLLFFSQIVLTLVAVVPRSLPALSWICLQTKRCKSLSVLTCLPTLHLLSSPATQKREPRKNWVQKYSEHSSFLWFTGNTFNLFFLFWKSSGTPLFHPLYCKILIRDYLAESRLQHCLCK